MKRLEAAVDQPLFQRTGRGVVLTHPGERLLVHAQRILRLHDEAMADLCGTGLSGTIRFGCPDDYAEVWLPALLRQFSSQHPQAIVEVVCGPTPRLIEQLDKRAVDLAMISLPDDGANGDIIRREQLVWIGYPGPNPRISIRCRWRCPIATRSITSRPARRWIARAAITASRMRAAVSRG